MAKQEMGGRWTAEQARSVLEAWEQSGESGAAYARAIGVVAQRLFWWRRRLAEGGARVTVNARSMLVPVTVRGAVVADSAAVVVTTRGGARIEVHEIDATTAAWVAAVLEGEGRS